MQGFCMCQCACLCLWVHGLHPILIPRRAWILKPVAMGGCIRYGNWVHGLHPLLIPRRAWVLKPVAVGIKSWCRPKVALGCSGIRTGCIWYQSGLQNYEIVLKTVANGIKIGCMQGFCMCQCACLCI